MSNAKIGEDTRDFMPGNDDFGFFIKTAGSEPATCRLKVKFECDYGLGTVKPIKNSPVVFKIKKVEYSLITDDQGIADGLFECAPNSENEKIKIKMKKFESEYKASQTPKIFSLPESKCW
ncbi:MAG: hypothetical protein ABL930_06195, partial [Pseudobdellovibrio sp.]